MSGETRRRAERIFYRCHDWLQEHGIRFHQTIDGRWVLDENKTEQKHQNEGDV